LSEAIAASVAPPRGALRWRILAGILAAFHVAYVVFVLFGALLVLVWPLAIWIHLASVAWAAGTMLGNLGCPVTTWEKDALRRSGQDPYAEGFLQHHVLRRTFSPGNERRNHVVLGLGAIALNAAIYAAVLT
jgi:hypothetical protein